MKNTTSSKLTLSEDQYLQVFARHKHIWDFFNNTGEMVNFHLHIQQELLEAYQKLHDPYYHYNRTCPVCIAEFIHRIYNWYTEKIKE